MELHRIYISGYKAFSGFEFSPAKLEVLVGPNGSGKSTLIDFISFIRTSLTRDIPPSLHSTRQGQNPFSDPDGYIEWEFIMFYNDENSFFYNGTIRNQLGKITVESESLSVDGLTAGDTIAPVIFESEGTIADTTINSSDELTKKVNQLSLRVLHGKKYKIAHTTREYILHWTQYSSFSIDNEKIRAAVLIEQDPFLYENCSNLSSVLHYFMTEHPKVFNELQFHLKSLVPGFSHLTVKARGGPGEVMAFWREEGVEQDLSLADLSDGILRLLCWMALFLHPKPPTLICIDEPDLGVHPRTLPLLAGLIKKASMRTQIFVTTHNSYFLSQFDLENITVFRKENGATKAHKPKDSATLRALLDEFGQADIANMHLTEELELL